jgi:hypothetical protein
MRSESVISACRTHAPVTIYQNAHSVETSIQFVVNKLVVEQLTSFH